MQGSRGEAYRARAPVTASFQDFGRDSGIGRKTAAGARLEEAEDSWSRAKDCMVPSGVWWATAALRRATPDLTLLAPPCSTALARTSAASKLPVFICPCQA